MLQLEVNRERRKLATSCGSKLVDIPEDTTQHHYYQQHETKPIERIEGERSTRPMETTSKSLTHSASHYLHLAVWLVALAAGGGGLVAGLNLEPGHLGDHQYQHQHQQNSWPTLQQRNQASWQQFEEANQPVARQQQQQEAASKYWLSREQAELAAEEHEQLIGAQQQQQQHFQQPYLTQINGRHQQVVDSSRASTAPTISRQVMAPPPFYEMSLAPANVLQIESSSASPVNNHDNLMPASSNTIINERVLGARSLRHQELSYSNQLHDKPPPISVVELGNMMQEANNGQLQKDMSNKVSQEDGTEGKSSQLDGSSGNQPAETEKSDTAGGQVEPRQRRRIFNRILKKAEWNHLFVELSKVFLRYFLDLALKDIIGKQAGGTGASDSTTSRKKLDAQSELIDLLKDFVKTTISNI